MLFQILAHASLVHMFFWAEPLHWLAVMAAWFVTGSVGMSAGFHRLLAHRAWQPRWGMETVCTLAGTLGGTGSSVSWVAVHRAHHRWADTPRDPHSNRARGWLWVQFASMFYPARPAWSVDLLRRPMHRFMHNWYWLVHVIWAVILAVVGGPELMVMLWLAPAAVLWQAGSLINNFGHWRASGARKPTNHVLLGWLIWGEGWHQHHHDHPERARFGQHWSELDVTWWLIRLLSRPASRG